MHQQARALPVAPFASLMARANGVAHARLADTVGLLDGVAVAGMFEDAFVDVQGLGLASPVVFVPTEQAARVEPDKSRFVRGDLIDGTIYSVTSADPDGSGMTLLRLRKVGSA